MTESFLKIVSRYWTDVLGLETNPFLLMAIKYELHIPVKGHKIQPAMWIEQEKIWQLHQDLM